MKIGIFGGSFNPVHLGHERALKAFIDQAGLDQAFVIPSFCPPHKDMPQLWASFEDRFEMAKMTLGEIPRVTVSDIEKTLFEKTGKKSYTKVTVEHLKNQYEGEYYLYVGTDMFTTLHSWYECNWLFDNTHICVMRRNGDMSAIEEAKSFLEANFNARVSVLQGEYTEISSTEIRESIADGSSGRLISPQVEKYIKEHSLYIQRKDISQLYETVKNALPEKRYKHTLGVVKETEYLSDLLCPQFTSELCRGALLHDITKYYTLDEHLSLTGPLSRADMQSTETLHALSGAVLARQMGENMWRTIKYHTTGRAHMSLFEMIIFTADYTEETRTHSSCIQQRKLLHSDLESCNSHSERMHALENAVFRILDSTVSYLKQKDVFIHPQTPEALEYYRMLNEENNEKSE